MNFIVNGEMKLFNFEVVIVAGFTGRDQQLVQAHVQELAAEGINVPDKVPSFYLVPPAALVQTAAITVTHGHTSGEAEIALLVEGSRHYVTLVSDHTDRKAEALDIAVSKLACPKIIAGEAWPAEDVTAHWDRLQLKSWISINDQQVLYQSGVAGDFLAPGDLLNRIPFHRRPHTYALLTGTLPAIGGIRPATNFWATLHDPVSGRSISLDYRIKNVGGIFHARSEQFPRGK